MWPATYNAVAVSPPHEADVSSWHLWLHNPDGASSNWAWLIMLEQLHLLPPISWASLRPLALQCNRQAWADAWSASCSPDSIRKHPTLKGRSTMSSSGEVNRVPLAPSAEACTDKVRGNSAGRGVSGTITGWLTDWTVPSTSISFSDIVSPELSSIFNFIVALPLALSFSANLRY